jgi:hypothetical protein
MEASDQQDIIVVSKGRRGEPISATRRKECTCTERLEEDGSFDRLCLLIKKCCLSSWSVRRGGRGG